MSDSATTKHLEAQARHLTIDNAAHVRGNAEWGLLADRFVHNRLLVISKVDDVHPTFACTVKSENVLVDHCDKNFVFSWCMAMAQQQLLDQGERLGGRRRGAGGGGHW